MWQHHCRLWSAWRLLSWRQCSQQSLDSYEIDLVGLSLDEIDFGFWHATDGTVELNFTVVNFTKIMNSKWMEKKFAIL